LRGAATDEARKRKDAEEDREGAAHRFECLTSRRKDKI
jgi:hypothetical protein